MQRFVHMGQSRRELYVRTKKLMNSAETWEDRRKGGPMWSHLSTDPLNQSFGIYGTIMLSYGLPEMGSAVAGPPPSGSNVIAI